MPELDLTLFLIVCPLVFLGSFVDAIAGGGGLITLPAYLIAGVPPHMAIGTNKLSSCVGMAVSAVRLARAGCMHWRQTVPAVAAALAGSTLGALIALKVPADIFLIVMVAALPFVAGFLLFRSGSLAAERREMPFERRIVMLVAVSAICGIYDGFYGPGAGTFMLIGFSLFAGLDVRNAGGEMKAVNLASGTAALVTFAASGEVLWVLVAAAALFSIAGHYIGAGLVIKNGSRIVRPIIFIVLVVLFVQTAWDIASGKLF